MVILNSFLSPLWWTGTAFTFFPLVAKTCFLETRFIDDFIRFAYAFVTYLEYANAHRIMPVESPVWVKI